MDKTSDDLINAIKELVFQNEEKGKRAAELAIANVELVFQNEEKGKRAAELVIANTELAFQNEEKGKRASELVLANEELVFQNKEKGKRAAELVIANTELAFQNEEKGKRAAELVIANLELIFQNGEKEKRAAELIVANNELLAFSYVSSHDLKEPLRKIQTFASYLIDKESEKLSGKGKECLQKMRSAAERMQQLIEDLLAYSRINATERRFEKTDLNLIVKDVIADLADIIDEKRATVEIGELCQAHVIPFQFRQLMYNLVGNALKFSSPATPPHIIVGNKIVQGRNTGHEFILGERQYCHITVRDNGIGFAPEYRERIFEVFQKLHSKDEYPGTGIGLAIVKKIVDNHDGFITAVSELRKGATFDIYIPATQAD